MVGGARLELARLAAYAPQTYVSANSTTRPRRLVREGYSYHSAFCPQVFSRDAGIHASLPGSEKARATLSAPEASASKPTSGKARRSRAMV